MIAIPNIEDHNVLDAMLAYGGGFVGALALAAKLADKENLRRIKATWPEYWRQYSAMAAQDKE